MREIKFRAWEPEYKHMTYDLAFEEYEPINDLLASVDYLMQYTGLIDANKKDVYEGDILKITNPFTKNTVIKKVWWNGETARFNGVPTSLVNVYEVIGNIYETPSLLNERSGNG